MHIGKDLNDCVKKGFHSLKKRKSVLKGHIYIQDQKIHRMLPEDLLRLGTGESGFNPAKTLLNADLPHHLAQLLVVIHNQNSRIG